MPRELLGSSAILPPLRFILRFASKPALMDPSRAIALLSDEHPKSFSTIRVSGQPKQFCNTCSDDAVITFPKNRPARARFEDDIIDDAHRIRCLPEQLFGLGIRQVDRLARIKQQFAIPDLHF